MEPISVARMREADQYTINKGTPAIELMRRAAQGVFDAWPLWAGNKTLIVCGAGNNGGDGYALASIMKDKDLDVTILRVSGKTSEDGAFYLRQCQEKEIPILNVESDPVDYSDYSIIVDCMLGTGFQGTPREPIASTIQAINGAHNAAGATVIAVDINSGINGDTGEAETAIVSDLTVSIGFYKTGFFQGQAPEYIGALVNADIGIELPEE